MTSPTFDELLAAVREMRRCQVALSMHREHSLKRNELLLITSRMERRVDKMLAAASSIQRDMAQMMEVE